MQNQPEATPGTEQAALGAPAVTVPPEGSGTPVVTPEPPTPEEVAREKEEAQAGFESGFGKVNKAYKPETDTNPDATTAPAHVAAAESKPPAAEPKPAATVTESSELKAVNDRLSRMEGRLGAMISKFDKTLATATTTSAATGTGPTEKQVQAALANPGKMDELIADYPDFAPVAEELKAIRAEMGNKQQPGPKVDLDEIRQEFDRKFEDYKESQVIAGTHKDWEKTVASKPFIDYMLDGGPSNEEYVQMNDPARTTPAQAKEIINSWAYSHPDWWAKKGVLIFSSKAADSVKMLDQYQAHTVATSTPDPKATQKQRNKARLEGAITPNSAGNAELGKSDNDAFESGFKKVRKHSLPNQRI